MRIDIITVLPQLLESPFSHSILMRAQQKGLVELNIINLRDYASGKHKSVDDMCYGGGAGMVMSIEPIAACIDKLKSERVYDEVIYMSPDGELLQQGIANHLSTFKNIIILAVGFVCLNASYFVITFLTIHKYPAIAGSSMQNTRLQLYLSTLLTNYYRL